MEHGVATIDSSVGGLGGCPFAGPGASGNLATEDLLDVLDAAGLAHGVDTSALLDANRELGTALGRTLV